MFLRHWKADMLSIAAKRVLTDVALFWSHCLVQSQAQSPSLCVIYRDHFHLSSAPPTPTAPTPTTTHTHF